MNVDHVALVIANMEESLQLFVETLGGTLQSRSRNEATSVEIAFVVLGNTTFEIIHPWGPGTKFFEYLTTHGPGVHHLALGVDDLDGLMGTFERAGIRPDGPPVGDQRVLQWLQPGDTLGIPMQLVHFKK